MHDFHRVYANSGGALEKKRQRSEFFNGIYHNAHLLWKIPSCARLMRVDPHSAIDQWIEMLKWHLSTGGILRLVPVKILGGSVDILSIDSIISMKNPLASRTSME